MTYWHSDKCRGWRGSPPKMEDRFCDCLDAFKWPRCPKCGDDELMSKYPPSVERTSLPTDEMLCLSCSWSGYVYQDAKKRAALASPRDPDGGAQPLSGTESQRAADILERNGDLIAASPDLFRALLMLYLETADYIRINKLGDIHHNRSMQVARDALIKAGWTKQWFVD